MDIKELERRIARLNECYRKGEPEVSDIEYDALVDELMQRDPSNAWFTHPEPAPVSRKSRLPLPMKSLDKAASVAAVLAWAKGLALPPLTELVVMPKYDGLSLLCRESDGRAWSRGGSENEGQDCTAHLAMNGARRYPDFAAYTYGEFCFSVARWTDSMAGQASPYTGQVYKSPRNTAAGLLGRDVPAPELCHAEFVRYGASPDDLRRYRLFSDFLRDVSTTYGQKPLFAISTLSQLTDEILAGLFAMWRTLYYIDGLVIYIDDLHMWDMIGRNLFTGNPRYAIAYKDPSFTESYDTEVLDVKFNASKTGALKPVVIIDKVDTEDCVMDSPTGYNARWVLDKGIARGARVTVTRSGGVIPKILNVIEAADPAELDALRDRFSRCPHCGCGTHWNDSGTDIVCSNEWCSGRTLARVVFFFKTMGAENTGEETYRKLYAAGYRTIPAILHLTAEELLKVEGFGPYLAGEVMKNSKRILEASPAALLVQASSCFEGIGESKATGILNKLSQEDCEAFVACTYSLSDEAQRMLTQTSATVRAFYAGLPRFFRFVQEAGIHMVMPRAELPVIRKGDRFEGEVVCFTGFRDKEMERAIMEQGGQIATSMSRKVTLLVTASKDSSSSKANQAIKLRIPIKSKDELEV